MIQIMTSVLQSAIVIKVVEFRWSCKQAAWILDRLCIVLLCSSLASSISHVNRRSVNQCHKENSVKLESFKGRHQLLLNFKVAQ